MPRCARDLTPPAVRAGAALIGLAVTLLALPALADFTPDPNQPRDEIPAEYRWNPHHIFPADDAWDAEYAAVTADLEGFAGYQGHLGRSAAQLYDCLELDYAMLDRLLRLHSYAAAKLDVDQSVGAAQERSGRMSSLWPRYGQATAFITPEILEIDQSVLDGFLAEHEGLRTYTYFFAELHRQQAFSLSPVEERLMAMSGAPRGGYNNVFSALTNVDMRFPEIVDENGERQTMTLSGFVKYRASPVRNVRIQAAEAFFSTLKAHENVIAAALDGHVRGHVMEKEARGYDSCLAASLDPDNISSEAYLMLIRTINENVARTLHRYVDLRRKVLGIAGPLTFPDLYNAMVAPQDLDYSYDECRALLREALAPLGREYLGYLDEGLAPGSGWVDIYPNRNKENGAYSNGTLTRDIHPYILLNYDNTLDFVSTTAHEFGHAIHSIYSRRTQPPVYGDYTTFLAEIASTCNEELLLSYLLERTADVDTRLMLLGMRLENIRLSIFRQTLFAEFELRYHERAEQGDPLTAEWLDALYSELIATYYGPNFQMQASEEAEWSFVSQFFRNFYVFAYATGMTSGLSLAEQIQAQGPSAATRYIDGMLKAGSSAPPLDILRRAGVDLETPAPILDMLDLFEETVIEYDRIWTEAYGKS